MTFDAGTWWLTVLLLGFVTGGLVYLLKRALFGRIDKQEENLKQVSETTVKRADYDRDLGRVSDELEEIRRDYTPRAVHDKCYDEVRLDIKTIMQTYLKQDDFFRETAELNRKMDTMMKYMMRGKEQE